MTATKWWGSGWAAQGWAILMYDWLYTPFCTKIIGVEPWSLTTYGIVVVCTGVAINLFQMAVGERPAARAPELERK